MATNPAPLYQSYRPTAAYNPVAFDTTTDPKGAARNQRQRVASQGDYLQAQAGDRSNQYAEQAQGVENYLDPIESNMAAGYGGYNPTESAAINYSPEEQERLVTGAGISAGAGTASAVAAAERAAAAAGGNPTALATYRARAAQTEGAAGADAMTAARVAAKRATSEGAQVTGQARLGQQQSALGYYGNLQAEKNANALNESGLQAGLYGTESNAGNQATANTVNAAMVPTGLDKSMGFITGLVGAASGGGHKAEGTSGYLEEGEGSDAVVGEAGPEVILEKRKRTYMADGWGSQPDTGSWNGQTPAGSAPLAAGSPSQPNQTNWLQRYLKQGREQPAGGQPSHQAWNKTTPYSQMGAALGGLFASRPHKPQGGNGNPAGSGVDPALLQGDGSDTKTPVYGGIDEVEGAGPSAWADGGTMPGYRPHPMIADGAVRTADGEHDADRGQPWWKDLATYAGKGVLNSLVPGASTGMLADGSDGGTMPRGYRASRMMADGGSFNTSPPIITRPTRVHLDPGDQVVPLSYRPKAKVRPSAALPAMASRMAHA